jgi:hypothetical protein
MSRRDVNLDARLRHLGAAYYDSLHGRAAPADVSRALSSVAGQLGEEPLQYPAAAEPRVRWARRCWAARPRPGRLGLAVVLIAAFGLFAAWDVTSSARAGVPPVTAPGSGASRPAQSTPQPLIYMCQQAPCTNAQELEVFDQGGAPIFSVGEYGGASVFGDNLRVWAPGTNLLTGTAAVTLSWESPGEYDHQFKLVEGCTPPAMWESPQGIWVCRSSHEWKIVLRF